jgi:uncharacterized protein (TIRG00374 family)
MIIRLLKVIVSITLISVLLWGVDWQDIGSRLRLLDPALAITAFVLLSVQYPLSAWKWRKSIRLHGGDERFGLLLRILCIAFFFNNFLPTGIGGDAYRAYRTFDATARPAHAISAVILERLLGILALLLIGYVCAAYMVVFESLVHEELITAALLVGAAAVVGVAFIWLLRPSVAQRAIDSLKRIHKLEPFICSLRAIKRNKRHFPGLLGMSLAFQALAVFIISLLFASIGIFGTLAESGFTAAASGVASVLPISINGVGVMEGSFVVAALEAGLPYSEAVLVALCLRAYMLLASVAFAILYTLEPKPQRELLERAAE